MNTGTLIVNPTNRWPIYTALVAMRMQSKSGMQLSRGITPSRIARRFGLKGRTAAALVPQLEELLKKADAGLINT